MSPAELFGDPDTLAAFLPVILASLLIGQLCASLSVLAVLKRLAFIGQGISHAAFGGAGLAALLVTLGVLGTLRPWGPASDILTFGFVLAVALASAWAIAAMRGQRTSGDTAIGIVLAVSMGLGFLFHSIAARRASSVNMTPPPEIEAVLFGSTLAIGWTEAVASGVAALGVWLALLAFRRSIVFWAFDETGARSFGVRADRAAAVFMALLAVTVVVTMWLVGVVLATAMLILPGAIALRVSRRLVPVLLVAHAAGLVGVVAGLGLSLFVGLPLTGESRATWPPGPSIVFALGLMYLAAVVWSRWRSRPGVGGSAGTMGARAGGSDGANDA